jgi:hypothetical protein
MVEMVETMLKLHVRNRTLTAYGLRLAADRSKENEHG